jgi:hypothetical protein
VDSSVIYTISSVVMSFAVSIVCYGQWQHMVYVFQLPQVLLSLNRVWGILIMHATTTMPLQKDNFTGVLSMILATLGISMMYWKSKRSPFQVTPVSNWSSLVPQTVGSVAAERPSSALGADGGEWADAAEASATGRPPVCIERAETIESVGSSLAEIARTHSSVAWHSALADAEVAALRAARNRVHQATRVVAIPAVVEVLVFPDGFEALAQCQGAWQQVQPRDTPVRWADPWLQTFMITGRVYFGGDGSSGYLERRGDGAVLMEKGIISMEEDGNILCRVGKSGIAIRFMRLNLPTPDEVDLFRGIWIFSNGNMDPPDWLRVLTVIGRIWVSSSPSYGGLLEAQGANGGVLFLGLDLSLTYSGHADCPMLRLRDRRANVCMTYRLDAELGNPWHIT